MDSGNLHSSIHREEIEIVQKEIKYLSENGSHTTQYTSISHKLSNEYKHCELQMDEMDKENNYTKKDVPSEPPALYRDSLFRTNFGVYKKYAQPHLRPVEEPEDVDIKNYYNKMAVPRAVDSFKSTPPFSPSSSDKEMKNQWNPAVESQPHSESFPGNFKYAPASHDSMFHPPGCFPSPYVRHPNREHQNMSAIKDLLRSGNFQGGFPYANDNLKPATAAPTFEEMKNQQNHAGESSLHSESFQGASSGDRNSPIFQKPADEIKNPRKHYYPFRYSDPNYQCVLWEASVRLAKWSKLQAEIIKEQKLEKFRRAMSEINKRESDVADKSDDLFTVMDKRYKESKYEYDDLFTGIRRLSEECKCETCFDYPRYEDYVILAAETGSSLIPHVIRPRQKKDNHLESIKFYKGCQKYEMEFYNRNTRYLFFIQGSPFGVIRPDETGEKLLFNQRIHMPLEFVKLKERKFECKKENWQWDWNAYFEGKPQRQEKIIGGGNIPDGPPPCLICRSNPSMDDFFCADCINSIKV